MTIEPKPYSTLAWRTSSASGGSGECVEVASAADAVAVRLTAGSGTGRVSPLVRPAETPVTFSSQWHRSPSAILAWCRDSMIATSPASRSACGHSCR